MTSSLIPERPLLISPTLAATIGLEEAVLLHVISEQMLQRPVTFRDRRNWLELDFDSLQAALPFWTLPDIKRIKINLQEKGLIQLEASASGPDHFLLAINQDQQDGSGTNSAPGPVPAPAVRKSSNRAFAAPESSGRASYIPENWQPSEALFQQCAQHNIPIDFVEQRIKSFVIYWRERRKAQYSWHHTFLKWIVSQWRQEQSWQGARELEADMSTQWRPSEDALSILEYAGISRGFIEDAIPEFVLYWRERGLVTSTWNTKFIAHVRRQWAKFSAAMEHDSTPRLIPADYEPSDACFEVLAMANIDHDFAREQIREFVIYWQDRKEAHPSWNTKFLQHVKFKWAKRLEEAQGVDQRMERTLERFTDRSWAD